MNGIQMITAERLRQVTDESRTSIQDDKQTAGQIAMAAVCYALPPKLRNHSLLGGSLLHHFWPWHRTRDWNPSDDRVHELVKAGALISAEIDRIQRLDALTEENHDGT